MKLYSKFTPYLLIILITVISTLILWVPFIIRQPAWIGLNIKDFNFQYIYRQYDGLLYIIPAKTAYLIKHMDIPGIKPEYFAAHLPLYPFFIKLFALFFGYLKSMLIVNIGFTILLGMFFYYLISKFKISNKPLYLVFALLFLPRFLIVRSVGAPESLFTFLLLVSIFFFEKNNYLLAGFFGGMATMTKIPGILLFGAYGLVFLEKIFLSLRAKRSNLIEKIASYSGLIENTRNDNFFSLKWLWLILIPLGLIGVFSLYWIQYGDFFAFFHTTATVPMPYPFSVFNWQAKWVGTAWLEEIIFYLFIYILTVVYLYRSKFRSFFYFSLVFLLAIIFVQHRDISRYSLPLWPMAIIAFEKLFSSKKFLIAVIIILPAIYLYAWNFLSYNVIPIADWKPFL